MDRSSPNKSRKEVVGTNSRRNSMMSHVSSRTSFISEADRTAIAGYREC